jgi:hypothetical protein
LIIRLILRLSSSPLSSNRFVKAIEKRLAALQGPSVKVRFLPALTAGVRKLYSNRKFGQPVHAATFIRKRKIVLDQELARRPQELARILTHELFHFAWVRLSNRSRRSYEVLVRNEWDRHARGELGWSAESRKAALLETPGAAGHRPKYWREYLCESFCDTAAWLYSGVRRHSEFTLPRRYREKRAEWFRAAFPAGKIPI